jgi:hypothetical protein
LGNILYLERKCDKTCFAFGGVISILFLPLVIILFQNGKLTEAISIISSLVIALLTLALVWVEWSKRPELKLLDFIPGVMGLKAGVYGGLLSKPSRFLKIREASGQEYSEKMTFSVDLSNVGYEEIVVHEFVVSIDNVRKLPSAFSEESKGIRLILKSQQRYSMEPFTLTNIKPGFHTLSVDVIATTLKCHKEVWFLISRDSKKLRYIEMSMLKHLFSPIIKKELKQI